MGAKELLLSAVARSNIVPVPIPAVPMVDGQIYVRVMSAGERYLFSTTAQHAKTDGESISDYEIVAICACDEKGSPLFHSIDSEGRIKVNSEDLRKLREVDGRAIFAIAAKALEVSGLGPTASEDAKKNSEQIQSADSTSGSP